MKNSKSNSKEKVKVGLTLSGGGARGAYQAGVLRAIYDLCKFKKNPFPVISGVSAGSINGLSLAAEAEDFNLSTQLLWETWKHLSVDKIFKTDATTLLKTGSTWLVDLSLGDWFRTPKMTHLLDTSPLKHLLTNKINISWIDKNLKSGLLHAVGLSATDYHTGKGVTFFNGNNSIQNWDRDSGIGQRTILKIDHIMASTAIPIFFPPIRVDGSDYGDGGVGLRSPLSPAIHMGADRLLVIGLEHPLAMQPSKSVERRDPVTLGDIAGTLLNSMFLNSMDADFARMTQTNKVLSVLTPGQLHTDESYLRQVPSLFIRPSRDLGEIDCDHFKQFPFALRHLLKGFGVTDRKGWDLLSYLAFDKTYAEALLNLGYQDGINSKKDILEFFEVPASK